MQSHGKVLLQRRKTLLQGRLLQVCLCLCLCLWLYASVYASVYGSLPMPLSISVYASCIASVYMLFSMPQSFLCLSSCVSPRPNYATLHASVYICHCLSLSLPLSFPPSMTFSTSLYIFGVPLSMALCLCMHASVYASLCIISVNQGRPVRALCDA